MKCRGAVLDGVGRDWEIREVTLDPPRAGEVLVRMAVAGICLWGTLIGSMLPLIFRRLGADPAMASSPFVATFVDVTGIVIYFNIARIVLKDFLT